MGNKILVRFEDAKNNHVLVVDENDKYLGKMHYDLVSLIWTSDDIVEEDDYHYFWCYKDLLEQNLLK